MSKGDTVTIVVDGGGPAIYVAAAKSGRKIEREYEKEGNATWVVVRETTRGGTVVRSVSVRLDKVVSVTESYRADE